MDSLIASIMISLLWWDVALRLNIGEIETQEFENVYGKLNWK